MNDALSICWAEYARFQKFADERRLSRRSWGVDEALQELLNKLETCSPSMLADWLLKLADERSRRVGRAVKPEEALRAWMKNLATNRAKKFRAAASLEPITPVGTIDSPSAIIERADEVNAIRANSTDTEWQALWHVACDDRYECTAERLQMKVNSLKSLVLRCRRRLAKHFGAAT